MPAAARPVIYLGLGSNSGDRESRLAEASRRIEALGLRIQQRSSIYETEPVGVAGEQPWFLNQVIEAVDQRPDAWEPGELMTALLEIEETMGRHRSGGPDPLPGPRPIDIDLLLFGDLVMPAGGDGRLILPHPRLHLRRFVLAPLCEIAPEVRHPVFNKTCRALLDDLPEEHEVRPYRAM